MGCDYEFLIQLLYNGVWVPVICLPSKTPTGGFPLQDALWQMALKKGVRGNYGIQYPESYRVDGFLWHEESKPNRVVAPKVLERVLALMNKINFLIKRKTKMTMVTSFMRTIPVLKWNKSQNTASPP
jgi:hypothetical protein